MEQPEYTRSETEPIERDKVTLAEEEAALRRRETEVSASARADLLAALTAFKAGKWDEVITQLEALIESDPTVLPAWDLLGNAYWRAGRGGDTFQLWNRLRTIRPDYPPVYNWLGRAYMLSNDLVNARAAYAKSLRMSQPLHDEDLQFGRVLRWSGALEDSIKLLRPMVQAKPDRLDIAREFASALTSNREYDEALPLWKKLCASEPTNLLFKAKAAVALLHTGQPDEALAAAHEVLKEDASQMDALGVKADHAQFYGATPEDTLPVLLQMAALTEKPARQRQLTLRYVNLYDRIHGTDPENYPLERPAGLLARLVANDPMDADVRLALGELYLMLRNYPAAREQFQWVLDNLNKNNIRALRNLFEVALAEDKQDEAKDFLERLFSFNPRDPYRHYYRARWYLDQTRFSKALEEVDQLEAEGARGAISVLLYHGLSSSDHGEVLPASRLAEHIQALKAAGFRFVDAHQIPALLARDAEQTAGLLNGALDREVCITFDDARRDSMRYGTPVGKAEKVRFSMHVPVGYVEGQHPFICTWAQLRDYQKAGCWVFGGHSWDAHERAAIDDQRRTGFALPNHLWLVSKGRLETDEEYAERLDREYGACQREIAKELGRGSECNFFAYPFGDIGQLTRSNDKQAPWKNLAHCGKAYACGFIQTQFGYALGTDNPLLYQRFEPDRADRGADVVRRILENHPVNLARRLRAEIYAQQDKRRGMMDMLALLVRDGYPTASLQKLHANLQRLLGRKFDLPKADAAPAARETAPVPPPPTMTTKPVAERVTEATPTPGAITGTTSRVTQPTPEAAVTNPTTAPLFVPPRPAITNETAPEPVATNALPKRATPRFNEDGNRGSLRDLRNPLR
jgi:tetratricopeptide (TPR) repeat protein/peptidoglycan/xylan/chitin deacetylase (PgdA/CDA1 family)